ncbi:MAG TPA: hypothetical protein PKV86_08255 [Syntrophobacteraceae bacterium]|jgi:hypothetical protein|nr:hypothetical protein [Syntrophobacteraceae bacterium]
MTRTTRVLKELSELYELNRKLKAYKLKEKADKSLKEGAAKACQMNGTYSQASRQP